MPKATRPLTGRARDKYFRELFATEPELSPAGAQRLARACAREITQVHVRDPLPERPVVARQAAQKPASRRPPAAPPPVAPVTLEVPKIAKENAPTGVAPSEAPVAAKPEPPPSTFDPYAFSLTVLLKRSGRKALLARLEAIHSAGDLRRLAEAQHVAVPADISDLAQLRAAIIDGTAQRIADRRAAAS